MSNYKITIQYDGTKYRGWQVQKSTDLTIQGKLQGILEQLSGHPVEVIGSGRTDAGVHAMGQVANFHLEGVYEKEAILAYLNRYLPMDIAVVDIEEVDERFHARYHAVSKTYVYRIHTSPVPNVFERKFRYHCEQQLDVKAMTKAAEQLIGTHDFMSFCGNNKMKKSTVRTIYSITITEQEDGLEIAYTGDGFLQNMIRIMTGTLIEVGNGTRRAEDMSALLAGKDRSKAGYTVPPEGLMLKQVEYAKLGSN